MLQWTRRSVLYVSGKTCWKCDMQSILTVLDNTELWSTVSQCVMIKNQIDGCSLPVVTPITSGLSWPCLSKLTPSPALTPWTECVGHWCVNTICVSVVTYSLSSDMYECTYMCKCVQMYIHILEAVCCMLYAVSEAVALFPRMVLRFTYKTLCGGCVKTEAQSLLLYRECS